jgi:tRNA G10  N-methylase Trm11
VLDPFAGVGGDVIQMAATCQHVIAGELSPERASLIRHNARVYGVADRIEVRCCDFWDISSPAEVRQTMDAMWSTAAAGLLPG